MGRRIKIANSTLIMGLILIIGFVLRWRGITNPLLDDQGWRQADTASIAWHMLGRLDEFPDVFAPRLSYDGLVPQQAELEFPFLPYLLAWSWTIFGWADSWGRGWAIFFSLLTIWGIYNLGHKIISLRAGLVAAGVYAVLPLTVYYGRVVMPEPVAQFFTVWALASLWDWRHGSRNTVPWGAGMLMACAILAKLPQLMVWPVALILGFWPWQKGQIKSLTAYTLLALLPPMIYYVWVHQISSLASQFVSGILAGQVVGGTAIYAQTLRQNLQQGFSIVVIVFALLGLVRLYFWNSAERFWLGAWGLISICYGLLIPLRIPLDYYLIPLAPLVALLVGLAATWLRGSWGIILGFALISGLALNSGAGLDAKYVWDPHYLVQTEWLSANTSSKSVLILSDPPPMTFYYARRVGFRLLAASTDTEGAIQELQGLPGEYLIRLPGTEREAAFWEYIETNYQEMGPGVFRLQR